MRYITIIISLIIIGAVAYVLFTPSPTMAWKGQSGYNVRLAVDADKLPLSEFTAKMYMKPVEGGGNEVAVHVVFSDIKLKKGSGLAYLDNEFTNRIAFPVTFSKNGAIKKASIPEFMDDETQRLFTAAIFTPETVAGEKSLYKSQFDGSVYNFKQDGTTITRQLMSAPGKSEINSRYTAVLSGEFWLSSFHGTETGVIDRKSYRIDASYEAIPFDETVFYASGYTVEERQKSAGKIFDDIRNTDPPEEVAEAVLTETDIKYFNAMFFNLNDKSNESFFAMAMALRNNPLLLELIPDMLRKYEQDNDDAARILIGILEYVGTPRAQSILGVVLTDVTQSETSRMRAAVALNGIKMPTDDTVTLLQNQSNMRGSDSDNFIANTSYLALGSVADRLNQGGTEKYEEVRDAMLLNLRSGSIPPSTALLALGNTGDEYVYDYVAEYITAADPRVRSAAITASGQINEERLADNAPKLLATEDHTGVRSTLYGTFQGTSEKVVNLMVSAIYEEKQNEVKSPILGYLVKNADNRQVRETLEDLLTRSDIIGPQDRIAIRQSIRANSKNIIIRE